MLTPLFPRMFAGHYPASGSDQEVMHKPADRVGSGQEVLEFSRVKSGWVRRFSNIGRVVPGHADAIRLVYREVIPPVKSPRYFPRTPPFAHELTVSLLDDSGRNCVMFDVNGVVFPRTPARTWVWRFQAEHCFAESLGLCPDYPDAIKWKEKLSNLQVSGTPSSPHEKRGRQRIR